MRKLLIKATLTSSLVLISTISMATATTYDYVGNSLTSIEDPSLGSKITGSITFDSSITNDFTGPIYSYNVNSYSMSSSAFTLNQSNSMLDAFDFTLQNGVTLYWNFDAYAPDFMQLVTVGPEGNGNSFDWARNYYTGVLNSNVDDPGTWTEVSSVPLPAALPMFGAAVAGLAALANRRDRVNT